MTSREKVLTRLDSTGIRREDEAAVPVNGVTVPLPYMVIRTIEKDTWDDLGRVCVKTIMWTIALFTANKDIALECKIRKALGQLKPCFVPCGAGCTLHKEHAEFADVEPAAQGVARAGVYPYLSPVVGLDPYSPCSEPHICIAFQPVTKPRDLL